MAETRMLEVRRLANQIITERATHFAELDEAYKAYSGAMYGVLKEAQDALWSKLPQVISAIEEYMRKVLPEGINVEVHSKFLGADIDVAIGGYGSYRPKEQTVVRAPVILPGKGVGESIKKERAESSLEFVVDSANHVLEIRSLVYRTGDSLVRVVNKHNSRAAYSTPSREREVEEHFEGRYNTSDWRDFREIREGLRDAPRKKIVKLVEQCSIWIMGLPDLIKKLGAGMGIQIGSATIPLAQALERKLDGEVDRALLEALPKLR